MKNETWLEYRIGDIGKVQTGPFGSQLHKKDYVKDGTPILTVEHLGENRIVHQNLPMVSDEDKLRLSKYNLVTGDIVFSRVGSVDRRAIVTQKEDGWLFSGRCLRVRTNKELCNSNFLSHYFGQNSFKNYIRQIAVGATMPSINTKILSDIEVILPPLPEQKAIASILSAIDDKIELNLQMNKTLEEMAMALYKHWFVDFGPFQDGNFVESELGMIPEGWEVKHISDVVTIKYGKDHKKLDEGSIPCYGTGGIMRFVDQQLYGEESVLIPRKGSLSNIYYMQKPFWTVDTLFYTILMVENFGKYFFYYMKGLNIANLDLGSAVPSLTTKLLNSLNILLPKDSALSGFEELVKPLFIQKNHNLSEIGSLTKLRDTLLPNLISGKVRLKEFRSKMEEVL